MSDTPHAPLLPGRSPTTHRAVTLGVLGGGQLGRMFVHAAQTLGYRTAVLDPDPGPGGRSMIAYLESAFDAPSLATLRERFPDAILASDADAAILGLNSYSDGFNVVIAERATTFVTSRSRPCM